MNQESPGTLAFIFDAAAKMSPPTAVLGAEFLGIYVQGWIQWLTLLYMLLLVIHKLWTMLLEGFSYWRGKP